ncbi:MAG: chemotaxis protein CheW [Acidobacteriota bacterium]
MEKDQKKDKVRRDLLNGLTLPPSGLAEDILHRDDLDKKDKARREVLNVLPLPPSGLAEDILHRDDLDKKDKARRNLLNGPSLPSSGLAEDILHREDLDHRRSLNLETPTGPNRLYEFADNIAREHEGEAGEKKEEQLETWVTFTLADEVYGLPVSHVQEILRVTTVTRVPDAPNPVRGVTNMRGKVLPVVDLRVRLGLPPAAIDGHSRILVVSSKGRLLGLLVDTVQQVVRISRRGIQAPPPDVLTSQSDYIVGVYHLQQVLTILLDVEKVLYIKGAMQEESARRAHLGA